MLNNVADLKDPNDPKGRTYREVNHATPHRYNVQQLVELGDGCRLYVVRQVRDCDGSPMYWLGLRNYDVVLHDYGEDSLRAV